MIPHERSLVTKFSGKPFALIGINGDDAGEDLKPQLTKHQITWRSFKDQRKPKSAISKDWAVQAWPTLYIIDHNGIIRKRYVGIPPAEVLERELDRLVANAEKHHGSSGAPNPMETATTPTAASTSSIGPSLFSAQEAGQ